MVKIVERIYPADCPAPAGHYAPATRFGELVFVSGQLPGNPDERAGPGDGFEVQAKSAIQNLLAVLDAADAGVADILKVTAWIAGVEYWGTFNTVFAEMFGDCRPARAVVPVAALHYGYLVEIDAIAAVRQGTG